MSRWLVTAVLLGCWGCAFSLDGPDPNRPRSRIPRCDTSKGLVALDGVMATAFGVIALAAASEGEPAVALLPLSVGALYLGGAVAGNRAVDACKKAIDEYDGTYAGERFAVRDDEDEDDDEDEQEEERPRKKRLIPPAQEAGRSREPQPPPYQTPYPPAGYPNAPGTAQPPAPYPPQPPAGTAPPVQQPGQPPVAATPPATATAPAKPVKTKAPPKAASDDDWTDFWREVP